MKISAEKSAGISLLIGSALMFSTMIIHPSGGDLKHLLSVARITVISHSMAILALPFLGVGFWGLTKRMGTTNYLSMLSFAMMLTALFAGLIAATINGIALPLYLQNYTEATPEMAASIKPILRSNFALNKAFDFVFLGGVSGAILCWSLTIITLKKLPTWIGYFGLILSLTAIAMLASGFVFVNLHGFRLFIFANVLWIVMIGVALLRLKEEERTV